MLKIKDYIKKNLLKIILLISYQIFCIFSVVFLFIKGDITHALLCIVFFLISIALILWEKFVPIKITNFLAVCFTALCVGGILGTSYDFYTIIPFFDDILHTLSGVIFGCLGYIIADIFIKDESSKKMFTGKLIFAFCFSLAIGYLWEIFEFSCYNLFGIDMEEDTLVNWFNSYYISGTHEYSAEIHNITQTVIYYNDGLVETIKDGYLDLGLIDTLTDMIVCLIGTICFIIYKIIERILINKNNNNKTLKDKVGE